MHGGGGDGGGGAGEGGHGVCEPGDEKDGHGDCGGEGWGDCRWDYARVGWDAEAELREVIGCGNRGERRWGAETKFREVIDRWLYALKVLGL